MIITQVPFRMSFFGGGTDFPDFFNRHGGAVLSTTIDKYCYVNIKRLPHFFDYRNDITYSKKERVGSVDEIEHPAIRNALKYLGESDMVISYDADLPARTGLGTSSSFAVALLLGLHALRGEYIGKKRLAEEAIHLERDLCRESGGLQDQIAAAYGGLNIITFGENDFRVDPLVINTERRLQLNRNLLMFFSGISRYSFTIQQEHQQILSSRDKESQLRDMLALVEEAKTAIVRGNLDDFGLMLDHTWRLKRQVNSAVSTDEIDEIYQTALNAGAVGGKLLGAGGGGFIVFYVRPGDQSRVLNALSKLKNIPFTFESGGARVLYYSEETQVQKTTGTDLLNDNPES
ncbi:MAG: hypothetical protein IJ228_00905 [Succinivibrio sp.]|nr:hypothetical protein [Succinivibrio sp.]